MDEIFEQAKAQLMMIDKKKGDVVIPQEALSQLFETTRWQGKHA